jgi:hypothetical protein
MSAQPFWKSDLFDATAAITRVIEISGGLTAVAVHLRTSPQTVATMRTSGRVTNAVFALRMAELAASNGVPAITARVLSGMDAWVPRRARTPVIGCTTLSDPDTTRDDFVGRHPA